MSRRPGRLANKSADTKSTNQGFVLKIVDGPNTGKEHVFEETATIGRTEDNDIVFVIPGISRNHARICRQHGVYMLEDLGSANGTRLNGEAVEKDEVLRDGDYITISQATLQFSPVETSRGEVTSQTRLTEADLERLDSAGAGTRYHFIRSRKGKLLIGGSLALLVGGLIVWQVSRNRQVLQRDQSDVAVTYSDREEFFNAVFGYGQYDRLHKKQLIVEFDYLGGRATATYGAWGIEQIGEVVVLLNNQRVAEIPRTFGQWKYGLRVELPADKLVPDKVNQLIFRSTRNPPNADPWEVCYLQIDQEAIPPPDPVEAQSQFDLARRAWNDREIDPLNMSRALTLFRRSRNLLEALKQKPALYQEAVDMIDTVDKALTRKFEEGIFSARRAEKVTGNYTKARAILSRAMGYFGKNDYRRRELSAYLDSLVQGG